MSFSVNNDILMRRLKFKYNPSYVFSENHQAEILPPTPFPFRNSVMKYGFACGQNICHYKNVCHYQQHLHFFICQYYQPSLYFHLSLLLYSSQLLFLFQKEFILYRVDLYSIYFIQFWREKNCSKCQSIFYHYCKFVIYK